MRLSTLRCDLTLSHWGAYEIVRDRGRVVELRGWRNDADPSPIGLSMLEAYRSPLRIKRPAVREGWLSGRRRQGRGLEPFVEVSWETALDLATAELKRVISE